MTTITDHIERWIAEEYNLVSKPMFRNSSSGVGKYCWTEFYRRNDNCYKGLERLFQTICHDGYIVFWGDDMGAVDFELFIHHKLTTTISLLDLDVCEKIDLAVGARHFYRL